MKQKLTIITETNASIPSETIIKYLKEIDLMIKDGPLSRWVQSMHFPKQEIERLHTILPWKIIKGHY